MNVKHLNDYFVCLNCASLHGYEVSSEYIDFYENRHRIKRKSIYNRKYHLQNKILRYAYDIQIPYHIYKKILDIFAVIDKVLLKVNNDTRKRLIKIDFILNKLFALLNFKFAIPPKDSKKTLLYNENYWKTINSLCGEEIQSILDR